MLYQSAPAKMARPCNENGEQESAEKIVEATAFPTIAREGRDQDGLTTSRTKI